jgi:hypothetical protein
MFHLKELISILCLVLLAWTLVAPAAAPDIFLVLPIVAILCAVLLSQRVPLAMEIGLRLQDSSFHSVSPRAPPQQ